MIIEVVLRASVKRRWKAAGLASANASLSLDCGILSGGEGSKFQPALILKFSDAWDPLLVQRSYCSKRQGSRGMVHWSGGIVLHNIGILTVVGQGTAPHFNCNKDIPRNSN